MCVIGDFETLKPPVLLFIVRTRQILYVHKLHHIGGACLSEQRVEHPPGLQWKWEMA